MAIAAVMPNDLPAQESLGNRNIDSRHNWEAAYYLYPNIGEKSEFYGKN